MGKQKNNVSIPTYFEISSNSHIQRYTTTEYLPGRKEVFDFCQTNRIPIANEYQVITIILRSKNSNIVLMSRK